MYEAPRRDLKIVMGDFSAELGGDQTGLEKVVRLFMTAVTWMRMEVGSPPFATPTTFRCVGNTYSNIVVLTRLCGCRRVSSNEIDFAYISNRWRTSWLVIRAYRGANLGYEHYLVRASVRLKLKQQKRNCIACPLDTTRLIGPAFSAKFFTKLQNSFRILGEIQERAETHGQEKGKILQTTHACVKKVLQGSGECESNSAWEATLGS